LLSGKFIQDTTLHTEFYRNRPSYVENMTNIFWLNFLLDTVYACELTD